MATESGRSGFQPSRARPTDEAATASSPKASPANAFTPGPWSLGTYDLSRNGWEIGANGRTVAVGTYLGGTDPAKANARLIAAAPDLYYAVCDLLGYLLPRPATAAAVSVTPTPDYAVAKAKAALAKVRGEQVSA